MKVYLIEENGGQYEDSYTIILQPAYLNKKDADNKLAELKAYNKYIESKEELWEHISDVLNNQLPDSYWEGDDEYDIWSDDFNIFIDNLKQFMPEILKSEDINNLRALWDHYNDNYLDGIPYYRIIEIEVV